MVSSAHGRTPALSPVAAVLPLRLRAVDEQLLRVALGPTEDVAQEWADLRARFDPAELDDPRVTALLPLVGDALGRAEVDDAELGRMRGVRRHTFVTHQFVIADLVAVLDALEAVDGGGIRAVVLDGIPLALAHYPDPSLRPTGVVDVLVDADAVPGALGVLAGAGWTGGEWWTPDVVARGEEVVLHAPDQRAVLHLRWRLRPWVDRRDTPGDAQLWSATRPLPIGDRTVLAAGPDDLLLHTMLGAYRTGWRQVPRWVADAAMVLRSTGDDFDWERLLARVARGHLTLPVRDGLGYAASLVDIPVPDDVWRALGAARVDRGTERRYAIGNRAGDGLWTRWCRRTFNLEGRTRTSAFAWSVWSRGSRLWRR